MSNNGWTRRDLVAHVGVTTAIGVAGCSANPVGDPSGTGDGHDGGSNSTGDDHGAADGHDDAIDGPTATATVSMVRRTAGRTSNHTSSGSNRAGP